MDNKSGFTLLEILVVVGIIALIAVIAIPNIQPALYKAKLTKTQTTIDQIGMALEQYKSDIRSYPDPYGSTGNGTTLYDWLTTDPFKGTDSPLRGRWKGPYISPRQGDIAENSNQWKEITFYEGGVPEPLERTKEGVQFLDAWEQPIIYIPNTRYDDFDAAGYNDNETLYITGRNATTYQLISFGKDGKSPEEDMGGLSWNDKRDNDGDGITDIEDSYRLAGKKGRNEYTEDDVNNW